MSDVLIRDVTMRDGLQDCAPIPTEAKLAIYAALRAAGVPELELTSFARPDRVPAMADAEQVAAATADDGIVRWGLVLNRRGAERALAAGMRHLQFVYSVSEAHNLENTGLTVAQSQAQLADVAPLALAAGARIEVTLATAFGCPFDGPVDPDAVRRAAAAARASGVTGIGLADTIGTAVPTEVSRLFRTVVGDHPDLPIGAHLHDTRGLAIANALAALEAGAGRLDGSVGGLGGCPFAPGASGNLALEDLVHGLTNMGIGTGVDVDALIAAAELACGLVGRSVDSHVGIAGPRFARLATR